MFKSKKGLSLGAAPGAVMLLVMIALISVVGVKINTQLQSGYSAGNAVYDAAQNSTLGIAQITSNLTLVGIIVIMAIVIALLFAAFGGQMRGSGGL